MSRIRLVVGLGNPGTKYKNTRHNAGFILLDELSRLNKFEFKKDELSEKDDIIFLKPQDYMNNSGIAVKKISNFKNIKSNEILVIHDELDIPTGSLRVKLSGGNAGHNGLKSIQEHLGTADFYRLRIGIGRSEIIPVVDWVLGRFTDDENRVFRSMIDEKLELINSFIFNLIDFNQFKQKINN